MKWLFYNIVITLWVITCKMLNSLCVNVIIIFTCLGLVHFTYFICYWFSGSTEEWSEYTFLLYFCDKRNYWV